MTDKTNAFQQIIQTSTKPVLIDFWAYWCGYCRRLMPVMTHLKTKWNDRLTIIKIDVEEYPSLVERYQIEVIPCLLLLVHGTAVSRLINPSSINEIETWLQTYVQANDPSC